jgi:uncharacterized protein
MSERHISKKSNQPDALSHRISSGQGEHRDHLVVAGYSVQGHIGVRLRIAVFVAIIQSILFLAHVVIYETWIYLWAAPSGSSLLAVRAVLFLLSLTFVSASLLAFRFSNPLVRAFYRLAAAWAGLLNFLFFGACLSWLFYGLALLIGWRSSGPFIVGAFLDLAVIASAYGLVNAGRIRTKRVRLELANLPDSWHGRVAALVSDTHLGHVRNYGFSRKVATMLAAQRPDVVFIVGDFYDGTRAELTRLAQPWSRFPAALGVYFVAGNHEEFSDPAKYLDALRGVGVRVLENETVTVEGMQIVGVDYRSSVSPERFASVLSGAGVDPKRPSILLSHAPHNLEVGEHAGISLQLSGHTHRGQMIPYSWIVDRIFGKYAYGLHHFGKMLVYTSCGAGTWGPPLRVGTNPEIVLIRFE